MREQRHLTLSAMPIERGELRTVFSERPGSIRREIEEPQSLRSRGWDLRTGDRAKFIDGELIRVEGNRSIIDLYRDGTLIFGGLINCDFLAWSDKTDSRLHPLALTEVVINFARLYQHVLEDLRTPPSRLEFRVELRNLWLGSDKTSLPAGPVTDPWWESRAALRLAPADTWGYKLVVPAEAYIPDRVAFQLVRELYLWFGHSEESIPYKKDTDAGTVSDADAIASIR
jgi:hypothetical protein